jgi:hypothetical protein
MLPMRNWRTLAGLVVVLVIGLGLALVGLLDGPPPPERAPTLTSDASAADTGAKPQPAARRFTESPGPRGDLDYARTHNFEEPDEPRVAESGARTDAAAGSQAISEQEPGPFAPLERVGFILGQAQPEQNLGAERPGPRSLNVRSGVRSLNEVAESLRNDRRGLLGSYYGMVMSAIWGNTTEMEQLARVREHGHVEVQRIDRQVYFPDNESFRFGWYAQRQFAVQWDGYFVVEKPGDYWLFWGSSKGGRVELAGETVLLRDQFSRYVEVSTVLSLEAGIYPLRIEFIQFDNGAADWRKAAACFMWVPEGEQRTVAVPPEMLLLPERLWEPPAPRLGQVSPASAGIGDAVTLSGDYLWPATDNPTHDELPVVTFDGLPAEILSGEPTRLRVRVPVGAATGDIVVSVPLQGTRRPQPQSLPSEGVPFTVTTVRGLRAEWYDLGDGTNISMGDTERREPDVRRIEEDFRFANRGDLDVPFRHNSLAVRWQGYLHVPDPFPNLKDDNILFECLFVLEFHGTIDVRIWVGGSTRRVRPGGYSTPGWLFHGRRGERIPVAIEATVEAGSEFGMNARISTHAYVGGETADEREDLIPDDWHATITGFDDSHRYFLPPEQPVAPPEILSVTPLDADQYPDLPYPPTGLPDVREGQRFEIALRAPGGMQALDFVTVAVDGIVALADDSVPARRLDNGTDVVLTLRMPESGLGEGRVVASTGELAGEPFLVNIANKGLVGYLFDFPLTGGLSSIPDLAPLHCHSIRKDKRVRFETTADFNLPFPAETFVIEWHSNLVIEEAGEYRFTGRTDDGMRLWLDNRLIIDANHLQAPAENSSEPVYLVPGTYNFRMQFFENTQHEVCVLYWQAERDGVELIPREVIPARAFTLDPMPPLPPRQATGLKTDGTHPG